MFVSMMTARLFRSFALTILSVHRPNVCSKVEARTVTKLVPCLKSYDHLVKVWSRNCTNGRRVCPVYEHKYARRPPPDDGH